MPGPDKPSSLIRRLARQCGIQTSYQDDRGNTREAGDAGLLGALGAFYKDIDTASDFGALIKERQTAYWHWQAEPCAVAWDGDPAEIELRLPVDAEGSLEAELQLESGETRDITFRIEDLPVARTQWLGGRRYAARTLQVADRLPIGYHHLRISHPQLERDVLLIASPLRAWEREGRKRWGAFLPLYALRSESSWGAGDYSDLEAFGEWVSARGGNLIATLPISPTYLGEPYEPSPYMPVSRLHWSEFYVDPRRAPGFAACREAVDLVASRDFAADIEELSAAPMVDYRRQMALKRGVLTLLANDAFRSGDEDLAAFLEANDDVTAYAHFRSARERFARPWREWPDDAPVPTEDEAFRFYAYAQYLAQHQLTELSRSSRLRGDEIYLDLPLGCHPDGFDTWRFQGSFASNVSCGAPPDALFTAGQNWGFPPLHPQAERESGYPLFRRVVSHHLEFANVLRIDHVMGLHRLFWVPNGLSSTEGVYVRYNADELYAILCLESHRMQTTILGENLGTVPGYVNRALARHGIYKSYVLQYELASLQDRLKRPTRRTFASLNTHDMPPFAGFLSGRDIELRTDIGMTSQDHSKQEQAERLAQREHLVATLREEGRLTVG